MRRCETQGSPVRARSMTKRVLFVEVGYGILLTEEHVQVEERPL